MKTLLSNGVRHFVADEPAATALTESLGVPQSDIAVFGDNLAVGPVREIADFDQFALHRETYWRKSRSFVGKRQFHEAYSQFLKALVEAPQVVLWMARSVREQLLGGFVAHQFDRLGLDRRKLLIVDVNHVSGRESAMLAIHKISLLHGRDIEREVPEPRCWTEDEMRAYSMAWLAYASLDPSRLNHFIESASNFEAIRESIEQVVRRYPSRDSGLGFVDEVCLQQVASNGPSLGRVIGHSIGALLKTRESIDDDFLVDRVLSFADQRRKVPLVRVVQSQEEWATWKAFILPEGKQVLDGAMNAYSFDAADEWIGGFHLHGRWPLPYRKGGRVVTAKG
ncbi:MAG: DUF1835 domain-containing protein [Pseudomonadota bacterium]